MPLPFHVSCTLPAVRLFELDDGRFQMIEPGPIAPFMDGYRYLLVEQALADHLGDSAIEGIRLEPAVIFDRGTGDELHGHVRVHVAALFTVGMIHDLNLSGARLLTLNDSTTSCALN